MPILLYVLIFLFFLCLMEGAVWYLADPVRLHQRQIKKRLEFLHGPDTTGPEPRAPLLKLKSSRRGISSLVQSLAKLKIFEPLRALMLQADMHWPLVVVVFVFLALGGVGLLVGLSSWGPLGGLGGLGLGLYLPYKALKFKKKRRLKRFEKQLPGALELLARGLRAGHAFTTGMQLVATEMPNPLGLEFYKTFMEFSHGMDLNTALNNLCLRVDLRDLKFFTTAVMIQRETGGNLAEILDKIGHLIRERFKLRNQVKALTAEGRLSGMVLTLLPPVVALILFYLNRDYMMLLVDHPWGRLIAMTALGFQLIGMLIIRKIVKVKV
jgi:tight adherence protein B